MAIVNYIKPAISPRASALETVVSKKPQVHGVGVGMRKSVHHQPLFRFQNFQRVRHVGYVVFLGAGCAHHGSLCRVDVAAAVLFDLRHVDAAVVAADRARLDLRPQRLPADAYLTRGSGNRQWDQTLDDYVLPVIGRLPIADVSPGDVKRVQRPARS